MYTDLIFLTYILVSIIGCVGNGVIALFMTPDKCPTGLLTNPNKVWIAATSIAQFIGAFFLGETIYADYVGLCLAITAMSVAYILCMAFYSSTVFNFNREFDNIQEVKDKEILGSEEDDNE